MIKKSSNKIILDIPEKKFKKISITRKKAQRDYL